MSKISKTTKKSLYSIQQLDKVEVDKIMAKAKQIKKDPNNFRGIFKDKVLFSIFLANSTRTRISTETAWLRLGGQIVSVVGKEATSIKKGESLIHTLKVYVNNNPDCIALRTDKEGVNQYGAQNFAHVSWLNCGEGNSEHPTQSLLDLLTIQERFVDLAKLKIAFVGDIKHGRTIKSLARLLNLFGTQFSFVAPDSLHAKCEIQNLGIDYQAYSLEDLPEILAKNDIVYATRPQLERMSQEDKAKYSRGVYQINSDNLGDSKCLIMHPLPIDSAVMPEIHPDLDEDARCIFFEQASNGLWARMAIFLWLEGYC